MHNTTNEEEKDKTAEQPAGKPFKVRLPGFINDADIGLGDVVKKITYAAGIKPCGSCNQRAATLNRWMVFSGRQQNQ